MGIKIQINSLPALEHLFKAEGGGEEIEITLKERVVEEFAKKHIKCIVDKMVDGRMSSIIQQEVNSKIIDATSVNYGTKYTVKNEAIKQVLDEAIAKMQKDVATEVQNKLAVIKKNIEIDNQIMLKKLEQEIKNHYGKLKIEFERKFSEEKIKEAAIDLLNEAFYKGAEKLKKEDKK